MYRSPVSFAHPRRLFMNATFAGAEHASYGCASHAAIGHRRMRTFGRAAMPVGGASVNWYASVSISLSGWSFSTASATWFTNHRYSPECAPPYFASTALHWSHSQKLYVSFCETE